MKILNLKLVSIIFLSINLLLISSCKKEELELNQPNSTAQKNIEITSRSGILIFKNKKVLNKEIINISKLSATERENWENRYNFLSQERIFEQINKSEIELENNLFKGINEDISLNKIKQLGLYDKHSSIYNKYIKKGIIKQVYEDDGSYSFKLTVINPALSYVLNVDGIVIVNDTIYQYTANSIKILTNNTISINEFKNTNVTNEKLGIYVFPQNLRSNHSWSQGGNWHYETSKKRYSLYVYGYSSHSASLLNSSFYVEAKGQEKKWWSWKYRNSYKPIYRIVGNWKYRYVITYNNGPFVTKYSISDNDDYHSPFAYTLGGSNHCKFYLVPNGLWGISSPWYYYDGINVYYYRFTCDFYTNYIFLNRG